MVPSTRKRGILNRLSKKYFAISPQKYPKSIIFTLNFHSYRHFALIFQGRKLKFRIHIDPGGASAWHKNWLPSGPFLG